MLEVNVQYNGLIGISLETHSVQFLDFVHPANFEAVSQKFLRVARFFHRNLWSFAMLWPKVKEWSQYRIMRLHQELRGLRFVTTLRIRTSSDPTTRWSPTYPNLECRTLLLARVERHKAGAEVSDSRSSESSMSLECPWLHCPEWQAFLGCNDHDVSLAGNRQRVAYRMPLCV